MCKVPWHDGYSCKESRKMHDDENDVAFQDVYKRNKWQRCPKCRHGVELVAGCNTVKCRFVSITVHGLNNLQNHNIIRIRFNLFLSL